MTPTTSCGITADEARFPPWVRKIGAEVRTAISYAEAHVRARDAGERFEIARR